jgi:hypothetical protein
MVLIVKQPRRFILYLPKLLYRKDKGRKGEKNAIRRTNKRDRKEIQDGMRKGHKSDKGKVKWDEG